MKSHVAALVVLLAAGPGCAARFDVVQLDPTSVARSGNTATSICFVNDESPSEYRLYGKKLQPDPSSDPPPDPKPGAPNLRRFLIGPDRPPRFGSAYEPLFITGLVIVPVGLVGTLLSVAALWGCSESEGCNSAVPAGTAIGGLGLAAVGGTLAIIGATGDSKRPIGSGELCDGLPPKAPATMGEPLGNHPSPPQ